MKKKHSRIGLLASLAIHTALIGGTFAWLHNHKVEKIAEQNSLSMEMVAALLEQPQVAVAPDPDYRRGQRNRTGEGRSTT